MKSILIKTAAVLLVAGFSGLGGWYLGMRDGFALAYTDVSIPLVSYHIAKSKGDTQTTDRIMEDFTGDTVSYVLDGRHSFPLFRTFPYRSQSVLSQFRAVWTPQSKYFGSRMQYPHRNPRGRDYHADFESILPAANVEIAARYKVAPLTRGEPAGPANGSQPIRSQTN